MTKFILTIFTFAVVTSLCSFNIPSDWVLFKKDNYQILFPGNPSNDSTKANTKIGDITVYMHMYESPDNAYDSNLVYGLVKMDYPPEYLKSGDQAFLKGFFNGAVNGAVEKIQGKLISEKEITIKNYPGREIKIDCGNGKAVVRMKIILVNATVFGLQTISFTGMENNGNASRFYDSFDIK